MKAQDLRIGNLILVNRFGVDIPAQIQRGSEIDNCDIEGYKPIPLTEEWLLKFGFKIEKFPECDIATFGMVKIFFGDNFYFERSFKIKYVHQLQNLYFALVGEELELKLSASSSTALSQHSIH